MNEWGSLAVHCLSPGSQDHFNLAKQASQPLPKQDQPHFLPPVTEQPNGRPPSVLEKGGRPIDSMAAKAPASGGPPTKKNKKSGARRWFNKALGGCPYGQECIYIHRCSNCRVENEHGQPTCPLPPRPPQYCSIYQR